MNLTFQWPWLILLLPLPLALYFFSPKLVQVMPSLRVPFFGQLQHYNLANKQQNSTNKFLKICAAFTWFLLILSVMRPQFMGEAQKTMSMSRNLMLAVDVSGSMQTQDMILQQQSVDRLSMVKAVLGDFIERRKGEQLGLILFGSQAYVQTPITYDRKTVQTFLDDAQIGIAGQQTAVGDAIGLAIKKIALHEKAREHVLILLTDGQNNAGELSPLEAAKLAASKGLKIYTIGVGSSEAQVQSFFGTSTVNPSEDLDKAEESLGAIAQNTGGRYFRARDTQELEKIYQLIDQLEPVEVERQSFRPSKAVFYYPLGAAFVLSMLIIILFYGPASLLKQEKKS